MKASVIGIVIGREYSTRVKKKSFLLTTFLVPILFAAMCILPALIMVGMKEEAKSVAVIDNSSIILPKLVDSETVHFTDLSSTPLDSVKNSLERLGYDAVLRISPVDEQSKSVSAEVYSVKPLGMELTENLNSKINSGIQDYRIASYGIDGLEQIMQDVKSDVRVTSYTIGEDGKESVSESGVYMAVSMVLGIIIYMFIAMFGGMVMSSVIEEKSSRVVEVLVSSVKATELMFGKIIGIALVALTQFLLWIVLTVAIVSVAGAIAGPELTGGVDPMELATQMGGDQAAEVRQLLFGHVVAGEILKTGIVDLGHGAVAAEELRHLPGVGAVTVHADIQSLQAAGNEEGVKGAHDGAGHILQAGRAAGLNEFPGAHDKAGDDIAVAVDVLGGAVDHDVGAQAQGTLQVGRAEGVVRHHLDGGVIGVGRLGHRLDVHDFQIGVAGGLKVDHLGLGRQGLLHVFHVGHVH